MTTSPELYPEHSIVKLNDAWVSSTGDRVPAGSEGVIVSIDAGVGAYVVEVILAAGSALVEVAHGDVEFVKES